MGIHQNFDISTSRLEEEGLKFNTLKQKNVGIKIEIEEEGLIDNILQTEYGLIQLLTVLRETLGIMVQSYLPINLNPKDHFPYTNVKILREQKRLSHDFPKNKPNGLIQGPFICVGTQVRDNQYREIEQHGFHQDIKTLNIAHSDSSSFSSTSTIVARKSIIQQAAKDLGLSFSLDTSHRINLCHNQRELNRDDPIYEEFYQLIKNSPYAISHYYKKRVHQLFLFSDYHLDPEAYHTTDRGGEAPREGGVTFHHFY